MMHGQKNIKLRVQILMPEQRSVCYTKRCFWNCNLCSRY